MTMEKPHHILYVQLEWVLYCVKLMMVDHDIGYHINVLCGELGSSGVNWEIFKNVAEKCHLALKPPFI